MKKSIGTKTIAYPTPVFVIGTYDKKGKPNAMTVSWGGISCSYPPCISISIKETAYTYNNITDNEAFTVNIPSETYIKESDYLGIASGKNEDKFIKTGLTPVKSELVDAPYIEEFPLVLECKLINKIELGLHTQFTGEIVDIKVDENLYNNGKPDVKQIKQFFHDPASLFYYGLDKKLEKVFSIGKELKR